MRLDLPSPVPLPDDVRHRALDAVLAGIDDPAPRRVGWAPVLLAAAVAVALVLSVSLAVDRWAGEPLRIAAPPAVDGDLARCAAAVEASGRAAEYPPIADWRVTGGGAELVPDRIIVVNDTFACLLSPGSVSVSPTRGTPMGDAGLVRLGPAVLAVLNPERQVVSGTGLASLPQPTAAPVIPLLLDGYGLPDGEIVVAGSYAGPLPDPAPPITVDDRTLPTRGYTTDDEIDLGVCLAAAPPWMNSRPELWLPIARHDLTDFSPSVLLARINDRYAGFCVLADDGPRFVAGALPPPGDPRPQVVAYEPADGERTGFLSSVLLTAPDTTVRVDIDSNPPIESGYGKQGAPGTIVDGLAFGAIGGRPGDATIYLFDEVSGATDEIRLPE